MSIMLHRIYVTTTSSVNLRSYDVSSNSSRRFLRRVQSIQSRDGRSSVDVSKIDAFFRRIEHFHRLFCTLLHRNGIDYYGKMIDVT